MRDMYGTCLHVGDVVTVMRVKRNAAGHVPVFIGYIAQVREAHNGALEALVGPHGPGPADWVGAHLIEAQRLVPDCLTGVL
jgi:hypothetical protein